MSSKNTHPPRADSDEKKWRTDVINMPKDGSRVIVPHEGGETEVYYHDDLCAWIVAATRERLPEAPKKYRRRER